MVKYFIALACVSVLIPSSAAAQQRASGTKGTPADRRTQGSAPKTGNSGVPVRPVTRSQDVPKPAEVAPAEQAGKGKIMLQGVPLGQQPVEMSPELQRELDRILQFWSDSSEKIDRLEGQHVRIVYDVLAEVERQAKGEFAYEKPDKGRMDVASVEITDAMLKARQREASNSLAEKRPSKVRLKKNGEPFDLVKEQQEMWSCDGQRIYSIDIESKEAQVAQLPPDMQGTNIMHSPLPFLFGMKPEEAKRRFSMSFKGDKFDPKTGVAKIVILPRLPQDARNWQKAELILDLKEFLPVAVQLTDPPGTKVTVFQFRDLTKNQPNWIGRLKGENPKTRFAPDLRGLNVHTIPSEADGSRAPEGTPIAENRGKTMLDGDAARPAVEEASLVNVEGLAHTNAVIELERQGLKRMEGEENQIIFEPGPPARKPEDRYKVMKQDPPAGTPLKPGMKVKLVLFNDPAKAAMR
jgi:TIGR03009 family protein